jgi:cytochrome c oxidase assembly protein subunit 15
LYFRSRKFALTVSQKSGLNVLLVVVFAQFALGVFTLLYHVPLWLGLAHQLVAFILLSAMTFVLHRFSK